MSKTTIDDLWISVVDRLPDKPGQYICNVRREHPDGNSDRVEYISFRRVVEGNAFIVHDQFEFVTDWIPNPRSFNRYSLSCKEEYKFFSSCIFY